MPALPAARPGPATAIVSAHSSPGGCSCLQGWCLVSPPPTPFSAVSALSPMSSCTDHRPARLRAGDRGLVNNGQWFWQLGGVHLVGAAQQGPGALTWRLYTFHRACRVLAAACLRCSEQAQGWDGLSSLVPGSESCGEGLRAGPGRGSSGACREPRGRGHWSDSAGAGRGLCPLAQWTLGGDRTDCGTGGSSLPGPSGALPGRGLREAAQ